MTPLSAALGDEALTGNLAAAQGELARMRDTLNSDPLALWQGGAVDTSGADRLQERIAAAVARADELVQLRDEARQRVDEGADGRDRGPLRPRRRRRRLAASRGEDRRRGPAAPARRAGRPVGAAGRPGPLLDAGRWPRLASELDLLDRELATATARFNAAERASVAALAKRDELRGLLGAYKAKAARLGAAEDAALAERYDRARDLLWTAPCDLTAAEAAVAGYQQAVLGVQPR